MPLRLIEHVPHERVAVAGEEGGESERSFLSSTLWEHCRTRGRDVTHDLRFAMLDRRRIPALYALDPVQHPATQALQRRRRYEQLLVSDLERRNVALDIAPKYLNGFTHLTTNERKSK